MAYLSDEELQATIEDKNSHRNAITKVVTRCPSLGHRRHSGFIEVNLTIPITITIFYNKHFQTFKNVFEKGSAFRFYSPDFRLNIYMYNT